MFGMTTKGNQVAKQYLSWTDGWDSGNALTANAILKLAVRYLDSENYSAWNKKARTRETDHQWFPNVLTWQTPSHLPNPSSFFWVKLNELKNLYLRFYFGFMPPTVWELLLYMISFKRKWETNDIDEECRKIVNKIECREDSIQVSTGTPTMDWVKATGTGNEL